jgi:SNF2 family DNA or RNA helicase
MEGGGTIPLDSNPRLSALKDILENDVPPKEKVIIWALFRYDIDRIMEALGPSAVRFVGKVKDTDRLAARRRFQKDPECLYFVANPAVGGTGLTLNEARTVVYYTNSFNLEHRLQSQARNYRIGQVGTVRVIDIMCRGLGIDSHLLSRLRNKYRMQAKILGDELRSWI